jgi:hypothetical protein
MQILLSTEPRLQLGTTGPFAFNAKSGENDQPAKG